MEVARQFAQVTNHMCSFGYFRWTESESRNIRNGIEDNWDVATRNFTRKMISLYNIPINQGNFSDGETVKVIGKVKIELFIGFEMRAKQLYSDCYVVARQDSSLFRVMSSKGLELLPKEEPKPFREVW